MKTEKRKENRSLYALVLVFVVLAAGISAAGYFYYNYYEEHFKSDVERQLSAIAQLKVDQLVQWRKERLGDGQIFYKNDVFSSIVKRYLQNQNDRDAKTRMLAWVGQVQRAYNYDLMMLVDAQLHTRLVFPENKERALLIIDRRNTDLLLSGSMAFQDFYRNEQDHRVYLKILVPILDDLSPKQLIAVLALRIDPGQYLYPLIKKWPIPSESGETLIIRREGNEAVFLNELRFRENTTLNFRAPLSNEKMPAVKAALGQEGIVEGEDYRGVPVVADVRTVPGSPWFLVARMDISEAYAPLRERLWVVIGFIGVLVFGAAAGVGFVWRHRSARFYRRQYEVAVALNASELRYRRLFEAARDGILILDAESGMVVDVNPFLVEMLGFSHEEFLGKEIWELGVFKDIAANKINFRELQQKEYIRYEGLPLETADGRKIEVEFVSNVYAVDHKKVIQCNIRDITERKRAEEGLRESERKFRETIAHLDEGYYSCMMDGILLEHNLAFNRMLGFELSQDLRGAKLPDFWQNPEDRNDYLNVLMTKGVVRNYLINAKTVGGDKITVMANCHLVTDGKGKPVRIEGTFADITDRKRSEEALHESEVKYRELFENAQVGMYRSKLDGSALLAVNSKLCGIFGYSEEEMLGNPATIRWADPRAWDQMATELQQSGFLHDYTIDIVTKSGEIRNCLVSIKLNADKRYIEGSAIDITERKRAEEALRESQSLYHSFVEQLPAAAFRKDSEGHYVMVNSCFCRLKGLKAEEFLGKKPVEVANSESAKEDKSGHVTKYAAEGEEAHELIMRTGKVVETEEEYVTANGGKLSMHVLRMPVFGADGTLVGTQGILFDITESKHAEEEIQKLNAELEQRVIARTVQLEAANKELEAFSYSVSHDLRAPLRAIDNFSRIVLEENAQKLDAEGNRLLNIICANTKKMDELITDLLDLSRVSRNELNFSRIDMRTLAHSIYYEIASPELQKQFSFSVAPLPDAYGDPSLVRQVWRNVISNAVKFTAPKEVRKIEIGGGMENGICTYFIKDSGVGFDPKYTHKLFGVFQRLHKAEDFEGTGVGLAIVQRIIHRHGGKVWAEGEVGEGAVFWFTIPTRQQEIGNRQ